MEYLDIYTENGELIGKEERSIVHRDALWHKTVHCWLYDKSGNIYFQIRKKEGKFYTTASGHIQAGETVPEGFKREIKEEIGIDVDINNCTVVDIVKFVMDRDEGDGTVFRDRAFANVYICDFEEDISSFDFDLNEIRGLVKMKALDVLDIITDKVKSIKAQYITLEDGYYKAHEEEVTRDNFLVNPGETIELKYGDVVKKVIEVTKIGQ